MRILKILSQGKSWYEGHGYRPKYISLPKYYAGISDLRQLRVSTVFHALSAVPADEISQLSVKTPRNSHEVQSLEHLYIQSFSAKRELFFEDIDRLLQHVKTSLDDLESHSISQLSVELTP